MRWPYGEWNPMPYLDTPSWVGGCRFVSQWDSECIALQYVTPQRAQSGQVLHVDRRIRLRISVHDPLCEWCP